MLSEPVTFGLLSLDLSRCHVSPSGASVEDGEEVVTMGFIIVTVVIVGAALLVWRFIFSPQREQELRGRWHQPRSPQ